MNPDPLYMLMRDMTQRAHGPRPYDGILGASQEKVVAYEGEGAGTMDTAVSEAAEWVRQEYGDHNIGTLIEIRVIGTFRPAGGRGVAIDLTTYADPGKYDGCNCTSSRQCAGCLL